MIRFVRKLFRRRHNDGPIIGRAILKVLDSGEKQWITTDEHWCDKEVLPVGSPLVIPPLHFAKGTEIRIIGELEPTKND